MIKSHYRTIICGAGIAGAAVAYYMSVRYGRDEVLIVDREQPLSLTTSKSGANYRDYWPDPFMAEFSRDSIDLMAGLLEKHGDVFSMKQSGYLFVSREAGRDIFAASDDGLHRCLDRQEILRRWPHLSPETEQVVSVPRAGSIDVQALGNLLLAQARRHGVEVCRGHVESISVETGIAALDQRFRVCIDGASVAADQVVLASGPFVAQMAAEVGVELPLYNVAQRKFVMPDPDAVVPVDMPFTICADSLTLGFDDAERAAIHEDPSLRWLLEPLPAGLHVKPEPGGLVKLGWAFNRVPAAHPRWSIDVNEDFPNIVIRGALQMLPGLEAYVEALPTPVIQYGGYYNRTEENWPLIGPTERQGLFVVAGLSGFGTMTACAAGDLLARHIVGETLPGYARSFHPDRYSDPEVVRHIKAMTSDGQL